MSVNTHVLSTYFSSIFFRTLQHNNLFKNALYINDRFSFIKLIYGLNANEAAGSDKPTVDYHQTAVPLSSTELLSLF